MIPEEELKTNPWAMEKIKVDSYNEEEGSMKGVDCPLCKNKGMIAVWHDGAPMSFKECECMNKRRSLLRIEASGLSNLLENYTMDKYLALTHEQYVAKNKALEFSDSPRGWFFIAGRPGTGKTHLCTAICGKLIDKGFSVRYMLWREEAPRLKASINERSVYDKQMDELCNCDVLYIDDFWKGTVSEADINLSFELLNSRYNDRRKVTIISSEKTVEGILDIDEAIGSRIYERCRGFCVHAPPDNFRLQASGKD